MLLMSRVMVFNAIYPQASSVAVDKSRDDLSKGLEDYSTHELLAVCYLTIVALIDGLRRGVSVYNSIYANWPLLTRNIAMLICVHLRWYTPIINDGFTLIPRSWCKTQRITSPTPSVCVGPGTAWPSWCVLSLFFIIDFL
jgi:hypothetical protein